MEQQSEPVKPPSISATRIQEIKDKQKIIKQIKAAIEEEEANLSQILATMNAENMKLIASASNSSRSRRRKTTSDRPMQDEVEKRQQQIEKLKEKLDENEKELQSWKEMGFNIEGVGEEEEA